jgi:hypothetical protein
MRREDACLVGKDLKKAVVDYLKVRSQYSLEENVENHEKSVKIGRSRP